MKNEMSNRPPFFPPCDGFGRSPRYLRLSITDRCNLHCLYCCGAEDRAFIPHEAIMRYEELLRFVGIAQKLGIEKARITGGEPFARKGCIKFLFAIHKNFPSLRLAATTNGTLLEPYLDELERIRPESINVSLDSFRAADYARLTGSDLLPAVLNNIHALLARGLRVKINAVALRGIADEQIEDFVYAAKTLPLDLRFIEYMPMGKNTPWAESEFLGASELLERAREHAVLRECAPEDRAAGPAKMFSLAGGRGRIGFITALSNHFCMSCNRLRLTAEGRLRACLFDDREHDLGSLLRGGADDAAMERLIRNAWLAKPLGARLLAEKSGKAVAMRRMAAIGG